MSASRLRVGVLVGGASAEREISLASGRMIADHLNRERYEVTLLDTLALMAHHPALTPALRRQARLLLSRGDSPTPPTPASRELASDLARHVWHAQAVAAPATSAIVAGSGPAAIDLAFIALHGRYGEDGTIQGLLEIFGIPYVGSGTLASALAMDKAMAKKVLAGEGLAVPGGVTIDKADYDAGPAAALLSAAAWLPAVVKPVCQGSSIGTSCVPEAAALRPAVEQAFRYDSRVLVEERVVGRELSVGVIGNRELVALPVVEIVSKREFFDYSAKYDPGLSEEICPAPIPEHVTTSAQGLAVRAHRALGCRGLSRCDMILHEDRLVLLEVNTLPGMTVNSLLPKAAAAAGIRFSDLLDRLIELALEGAAVPLLPSAAVQEPRSLAARMLG